MDFYAMTNGVLFLLKGMKTEISRILPNQQETDTLYAMKKHFALKLPTNVDGQIG